MTEPTRVAIRASTQDHLEIEDIRDGIVILKDGGCCLVIAVTSINFDLLSEKEQEATIYAYAALLNSLSFSIQISVRSQQKDISFYLRLLEETAEKETRKLFKQQIVKYRDFIKETVQKNNVLDKKFYLVIPMSALEIGASRAMIASLNPQKKKLPFDKNYILERAKINLYPKRDHLVRQLGRLGIRGRQLETQELIKLYFEIYNPEAAGQQIVETKQYQSPLVQSVMTPSLSSPAQEAKPAENPPMPKSDNIIQNQIDGLIKNSTK